MRKLPEGEGKKHAFAMRTSQRLIDLIKSSAAENGRSVSAEVEARLAETFAREGKYEIADDLRALIREEIRAALSEQHVQGVHASNLGMRDTMEAMRLGVDEFKRREALRSGPSNWIV